MCIMSCMPMTGLFCNLFYCYSVSLNSSLPTPQSGNMYLCNRKRDDNEKTGDNTGKTGVTVRIV